MCPSLANVQTQGFNPRRHIRRAYERLQYFADNLEWSFTKVPLYCDMSNAQLEQDEFVDHHRCPILFQRSAASFRYEHNNQAKRMKI